LWSSPSERAGAEFQNGSSPEEGVGHGWGIIAGGVSRQLISGELSLFQMGDISPCRVQTGGCRCDYRQLIADS
jgi:hypothetical protein